MSCLFFWYWSDCEADGCVCVWHVCSEGPWDKVHQVIGQAHTVLHQQGIVRIQTDVRVGSRLVSFLFLSRVLPPLYYLSSAIVGGEGLFGYIPFLGNISRLLRTWHGMV